MDGNIVLETPRLTLRPFRPEDLEPLWECRSDPETVRFEPYRPMTRREAEAALDERLRGPEMLAVERREDGQLLGNVCLARREFDARELGFLLHRRYWGRGYAREACEALVRRAFDEGAHRIYAECDPRNAASWRLLERLGFRREAHLRGNLYFWRDENGAPLWKDTYVYGKLRTDEANRP